MSPNVLKSFGLFVCQVLLFGLAGAVLSASSCGDKNAAIDSKKSNNRTELAKDFLSRNELPAARLEAQKAIRHNPKNAEAYSILGLIDFLSGVNNFRLLEIDDCLTGIDAEGLQEEMAEFFQAAESSFDRATKADLEYGEAYANQASAYLQLENYEKAIQLNEKALEFPHRLINLGLTRANLGWALFKSGDAVGAAKELRQALQFNPSMCIAKYRLGRVYFERKEWNKALEQFQVVVENESCPLQESNLYLIRTMKELSMTDELPNAIEECTQLAQNSCIAAQCRAGL